MGKLIYSMIVSLDGHVADEEGNFDWAMPNEEVLEAVNQDMANVGTYLYGHRMYQMMRVWETDPAVAAQSARSQEFASIWKQADKVVYSTTLPHVDTARTRLEQNFDPTEVSRIKAEAQGDLTVDGPTIAGHALRHGLVDEVRLLVCPVVVGGGLSAFPRFRAQLDLQDAQKFSNGMVQLYYTVHGS